MAAAITRDEFDALAESAAKSGQLKARKGVHGREFAVFIGSEIAAKATPDENGEYEYTYLLYDPH